MSQSWLSPRLVELTFQTDVLSFDPKVRVLVPTGYASPRARATRYPALWLLHGGTDTSAAWIDKGAADRFTADLPLIVVMPDGGDSGMYTDWWNYGDGGKPMWETFHIKMLLPWIDANFRTIPDRGQRAVAGLSMGGFGSMSYAARHPDLFSAAASFSGAVDSNNRIASTMLATAGLGDGGTEISPPVQPSPCGEPNPLDPVPSQGPTISCTKRTPGTVWGPYDTEQVRWRGDNPWDLAANLSNTDLWLYTRNGKNNSGLVVDPIEHMIWQQNVSLHDRLVQLGIPVRWHDGGPGTHSWDTWQANLQDWLPQLMRSFSRTPGTPSSFTYTSTRTDYSQFDWTVSVDRPALEFSGLEVANAERFSVVGSGKALVTTAPLYVPKATYSVLHSGAGGSTVEEVVADRSGRLTVAITLGPGNPFQQYTPQAAAFGAANAATRHPGDVGNVENYPSSATSAGSTYYRTAIAISRSA